MIPGAARIEGCENHKGFAAQYSGVGKSWESNRWFLRRADMRVCTEAFWWRSETCRYARLYRWIRFERCRNLFYQGFLVKTRFSARLTFHSPEKLYRRASRRVSVLSD